MKNVKEKQTIDVWSLLRQAAEKLDLARIPDGKMEAELFLAHTLGLRRMDLYLEPARAVSPKDTTRFDTLILERLQRKPAQYLIEEQEFWGRRFWTPQGVFIPRPETELLIETAINHFRAKTPRKIFDIGTGSGCIAITLALVYPNADILASDCSLQPLSVARVNAHTHQVTNRVRFFCGDLTEPLRLSSPNRIDLIISNPPYLSNDERIGLQPEVSHHEPKEALFTGPFGTEVIHRILSTAQGLLSPEGILILEIGATQGKNVMQEGQRLKFDVTIRKDYAGLDRIALLRSSRSDPS